MSSFCLIVPFRLGITVIDLVYCMTKGQQICVSKGLTVWELTSPVANLAATTTSSRLQVPSELRFKMLLLPGQATVSVYSLITGLGSIKLVLLRLFIYEQKFDWPKNSPLSGWVSFLEVFGSFFSRSLFDPVIQELLHHELTVELQFEIPRSLLPIINTCGPKGAMAETLWLL